MLSLSSNQQLSTLDLRILFSIDQWSRCRLSAPRNWSTPAPCVFAGSRRANLSFVRSQMVEPSWSNWLCSVGNAFHRCSISLCRGKWISGKTLCFWSRWFYVLALPCSYHGLFGQMIEFPTVEKFVRMLHDLPVSPDNIFWRIDVVAWKSRGSDWSRPRGMLWFLDLERRGFVAVSWGYRMKSVSGLN